MKKKFKFKLMWDKNTKQLFIGFGIIIGKDMLGIAIFNLFIGIIKD